MTNRTLEKTQWLVVTSLTFGNYKLKLTQFKSHTKGTPFTLFHKHSSSSTSANVFVIGGRLPWGINTYPSCIRTLSYFFRWKAKEWFNKVLIWDGGGTTKRWWSGGGGTMEGRRRDGGAVVEQKQFSNWGFRVYKNLNLCKRLHAREIERDMKKIWVLF